MREGTVNRPPQQPPEPSRHHRGTVAYPIAAPPAQVEEPIGIPFCAASASTCRRAQWLNMHPSRLLKDQAFDIHFPLRVVVEVQTMLSTMQEGHLQCAAHGTGLRLLEFINELFK